MTTNQLISAMKKELYDSSSCKQDFNKYDVESVKLNPEPFIWCVYPYGTVFTSIGPTETLLRLKNECNRLHLLRDINAPLMSLQYYAEHYKPTDYKMFYFDGLDFKSVTYDEVIEIYTQIWVPYIKEELAKHPEEQEVFDKPLKIVFSDKALKQKVKCEEKQRELGNTSFSDILDRLSHWIRQAVNHEIRVGVDFADYSFTFAEYVNDRMRLNGGIIFYNDKWNVHT